MNHSMSSAYKFRAILPPFVGTPSLWYDSDGDGFTLEGIEPATKVR
jgi:hypothetical protein